MNYHEIIQQEIDAISNIPVRRVEELVHWLSMRMSQGTRIITSGMGKAGQIAHTFATTLCSTGISSSFIHPSEAQHGDLGIIQPGDIIFVFSNSGKTDEIIQLVDLIQNNLEYENLIVGIFGNSSHYFEVKCAETIQFGPVEEVCPLGLTPTTSTTCMSVICDMIVAGLIEKRGFTKEQYSKLHHGGYLNLKARNIV
jgi:arabinose-5-phosphate isomerase